MSRKLNTLSALFAFAMLAISVPAALGQTSMSREKAAVVAIRREGALQLVGGREKIIRAMQTALNSTKERGVVSDVKIVSFEKASYLAVVIERQGTLFLPLEPTGGSPAGLYLLEEKYLYCASSGCSKCKLVMTGTNPLTGQSGPRCECDAMLNQGPTSECSLRPKLYVSMVVASFNQELLAIGFEEANPSANDPEKPNKGATPALEVSPGRPGAIKPQKK